MNAIDCIESIIGLSQQDCPCTEANRPVDASVSRSGYYIDSVQDGIPLRFVNSVTDCSTGGVWALLGAARREASRRFLIDLSEAIALNHAPKHGDFYGTIGKSENSIAIGNSGDTCAWLIEGYCLSALLQINALSLYSQSTNASVVVSLFSENNLTTPLHTQTVNTIAGQYTTVSTEGWALDLMDYRQSRNKKYWLTWTNPPGEKARSNKFWCCSTHPAWMDYLTIKSYTGSSISDIAAGVRTDHGSTGLGMTINGGVNCDLSGYLCSLTYNQNTFLSPSAESKIAYAILQGAVIHLASTILTSGRINAVTTLEQASIQGIYERAIENYDKVLKDIVPALPVDAMSCYSCKPGPLRIRPIIV